jgi:hypothetical protein
LGEEPRRNVFEQLKPDTGRAPQPKDVCDGTAAVDGHRHCGRHLHLHGASGHGSLPLPTSPLSAPPLCFQAPLGLQPASYADTYHLQGDQGGCLIMFLAISFLITCFTPITLTMLLTYTTRCPP